MSQTDKESIKKILPITNINSSTDKLYISKLYTDFSIDDIEKKNSKKKHSQQGFHGMHQQGFHGMHQQGFHGIPQQEFHGMPPGMEGMFRGFFG